MRRTQNTVRLETRLPQSRTLRTHPALAENFNPPRTRRRSQRLTLGVPVVVCGRAGSRTSFREPTITLKINKHGGLIALEAMVCRGEELTLRRPTTGEEQSCRVVYLGPDSQGKRQVGVEFADTSQDFWHIYFPPVGAKPMLE